MQGPFFLVELASPSVALIEKLARSVDGLALVVIDYLGLLHHPEGKSLYERVTATSAALKRLARTLDTPVLCLAQLNRASEQRQDKKPSLTDLRDSGAIEQDADGVMLLQRFSNGEESKPWDKQILSLELGKNHHGPVGTALFDTYPACGRVAEVRGRNTNA